MQRARRIGLALFSLLAISLIAPSAASAHAVSGIDYRFPLPIWLFALAAGAAVLASAPTAMFAVRSDDTWTGSDFYERLRPLHLGAIGTVVVTIALVDGLVGGLFGSADFFENPVTIVIWIDFWVGLGIASALIANVWDFISPLSAAGRALERWLAERKASAVRYPERLGLWPATALVLLWSWMELVWDPAKEPYTLTVVILTYVGLQLVAMAAFGAEVWLAHGEVFTVVARTLARFAPVELYVHRPAGPCRAGRCIEEERIGCASCWLDADTGDRGLRLRAYGSGVRREPPLGVGGGTFVLALLATVVYDGFSQTQKYVDLESWFVDRSTWLAVHETFLDTMLMVAVVAAFALAFLLVVAAVARLESRSVADAARRYAPTLIPIAAVYFVSHYFLYMIYASQFTWAAIADPLGREWVPDASPWTGVPGSLVWYLQVALIVWGHVVAVFEAHRVSMAAHVDARRAVMVQVPLILLMVGYTFTGLWVLGQVLAAP
ncbi:MAG TPA: hypothetical protein VH281_05880 [Gaiellaceae bacterium]|jgi:hypothetical protein